MGTATSTHQPLDRTGPSPFKRHASLRATKGEKRGSPKRMDRLRRSFRDSFRRRKETTSHHLPESAKPRLWEADEAAVRAGTCTFQVKYLGCVEVFESRGMQVCEEALKVLRNSRRRPVKAVLFISGDGLRVVEDETKGLIVDQTIEKVSFCAPDRSHEKGFSYICRDGTTRRWMCHGFIALKESGERLSHAVGCAFAACLERKQRREKDTGVTMSFDPASSVFTRQGSFRTQTITERIHSDNNRNNITVPTTDAPPPPTTTTTSSSAVTTTSSLPPLAAPSAAVPKPPITTHAIERPHATVSMLARQGSFRGFSHLNSASPFKRQLSLRISDLPSNLERTRSHSLGGEADTRNPPPLIHLKTPGDSFERDRLDSISEAPLALHQGRHLSLPIQIDEVAPPNRLRLFSLPLVMSPIPETSPLGSSTDPVSAMCQQLSQGLQILSNNADDLFSFSNNIGNNKNLSNLSKELFPFNNNSTDKSHMEMTPVGKGGVLTPPASASPILSVAELPRPEQWLGKVSAGVVRHSGGRHPGLPPPRAFSLDCDPFESDTSHADDWLAPASVAAAAAPPSAAVASTNPFIQPPTAPGPAVSNGSTPVKAFEVQM